MGILAYQWKPSCLEISELGPKAKQNKNNERENTLRQRSMERIENVGRHSRMEGQLISDKGVKAIQWREDGLFNEWHWENSISIY